MKKLDENWLTKGHIDFEYKKYMLLAYLQSVEKNFTSSRLYPYLGDLVRHYQNLNEFLKNKNANDKAFPKKLSNIDLENFMLQYNATVHDEYLMEEIEKILNFSIPKIKSVLEEGKEIYDWIESKLQIESVGIQPVELQHGYLFIRNGQDKETKVFFYNMSIFNAADEKYRSIATQYVHTFKNDMNVTYKTLKLKLIERQKILTNPAVYAVESELKLPLSETLLPIARRILIKQISI